MAEQNYTSKSFILSFKSHERGDGSTNEPYPFIVKKGDFSNSVVCNLFNLQETTDVDEKKEVELFKQLESRSDADKWFDVRIVVHSHKDFSIGQVSFAEDVASFAQEEFFPTPKKITEEKADKENYLPIIHITFDDSYVDNLYSNEKLPLHISRSYQVLDNSIWNMIIPYERIEKYDVGGTVGLYEAITEIDVNYQRKLYQLEIAHEYANLNARLTKQAFLSGSHASGVSPFIFHSESAIKKLIEKEFEEEDSTNQKSSLDYIKSHDWRFLLVDDRANKKLSAVENKMGVTKWSIIEHIFQQQFQGMKIEILRQAGDTSVELEYRSDDKPHVISVEYVETIAEAKKALRNREKEYDAILLDYYLDNEGTVEYGYQLLEDIYIYKTAKDTVQKKDKELIVKVLSGEESSSEYGELIKYIRDNKLEGKTYKELNGQLANDEYQIGPHKKLFFMFISAYSTAVYERLLSEGLNRSEKYWYIGEGACPTNTPELFKYHLLHLMERRLDQTGINDLSEEQIINDVKYIFMPQEESSEDRIKYVRKRAYEKYHKILGYHYDYFILRENDCYSLLVDSFLKDKVHFGAMLEHLLQLVHLTAFGTVRQWPEIWEEYKFFSRTYNGPKEDLHQLESDIEKYIIVLKSE